MSAARELSITHAAVAAPARGRLRTDIPPLTALRGVAALWVVGCHIGQGLRPDSFPVLRSGYMAVDIFFVLSGFILTLVHQDLRPRGAGGFFVKRLLRVYPLDIAVMLLMLLGAWAHGHLGTGWYAWGSFTPVLFMVEPFMPGPPIVGWLITNWSVGIELLCYLLFPLLIVALRRLPALAVLALLLCLAAAEWKTQTAWTGYFFGPGAVLRGLCGFGLGAAVAVLVWRCPPPRSAVAASAEVFCLLGLLLAVGFASLPAIPLWAAGLIACLAWQAGPVSALLAAGPLVWLGDISFSIYLVHGPLLGEWSWPVLARLRALLPGPLALALWLALFLAATLLISALTYHAVERPGRRLGARLARKLAGRSGGA